MKIIIIAAGSSTRLANHTKKIPKGLLEINGTSILEKQFLIFKKFGINDITIVTGPNKEKFDFENIQYLYDEKYAEHDVLGSMMVAKDQLADETIFSYSDIIFDESVFSKIFNFKGDIGIAIDLNWEKSYLGRTLHPKEQSDNVIIENNHILKIKKNISTCDKNQKLGEFVGLTKLSKKGCRIFVEKYDELQKLHKGEFHEAPSLKNAYLTDMLQELIDNNICVAPILIEGKWCEIDTPQDLERAKKEFF